MKRLLVALDASERAAQVLDAAARLAELTGAKLILYRAITVPPELPREVLVTTDTRLEDVLVRNGYGGIDRILGTTAAKVVNHADRNVPRLFP